jgi:hypothetical protein
MRKIIKRLTTQSTWAASTDLTPVDLPREGIITEITIRSNLTATLTAAAYSDLFRRALQNIKIEGDGGRAYLGMSGTQMNVLLDLWNLVTMGAPTLQSNGAGIPLASPDVASTTFNTILKFHPGSNPKDPFDLTAGIPAKVLSMLQAKLTTAPAAVTDAAGAITAGTFNYEVAEVVDHPIPPGLMTPAGSTLVYTHTATYSDFSYKIDVPSGSWLRGILMCIRDDTATVPRRKSDEVTGVRLELPKTNSIMFEQSIQELAQTMMARFSVPGISQEVGPIGAIADLQPRGADLEALVPAGFVYIDLRPFANPLYGLDLRNYQTGDVKLGLTIGSFAAGDSTTIYWDQLAPVDPLMVGK